MPQTSTHTQLYAVKGIPGLHVEISITEDVNREYWGHVPAIGGVEERGSSMDEVAAALEAKIEQYFQMMHRHFIQVGIIVGAEEKARAQET